jgi:hypothetical protein|tara:strand:+ start:97 stop:198 length:102 start_codon:yes stop_codon:yes gene_type:complete
MVISEAKSRLEAITHIDRARFFLDLDFEFRKPV